MSETQGAYYSISETNLRKIRNLLRRIESPLVQYSADQLVMANDAIEMIKLQASTIATLLPELDSPAYRSADQELDG